MPQGYRSTVAQGRSAPAGARAPSGAPLRAREPQSRRPISGGPKRPPFFGQQNRGVLIAIGIVLALVIAALLIVNGVKTMRLNRVKEEIAPYDKVYGDNIFINDVNISRMTPEQALAAVKAAMDQRVHSWQLDLTSGGWKYYTLNYPVLGIDYTESQLYPFLNEAWALTHTGDPFERREAILKRRDTPYHAYTTEQKLDDTNLDHILRQIADAVYTEPADAMLILFRPDEKDPFVIRDEQMGRAINIEEAKKQILEMAATGQGGTYDMVPVLTAPQITRKDIERTVALRAEATTVISKSSTENRTNNIRAAFSKINGRIMEPGETFSFNRSVGERTVANGFFEAIEYVKGDLATGIGGGVCQASTTLYQAALMGEMKIIKRDIHSFPVNYTEKGQDATVYFTRDHEIDFRFKNTSPGRIYIVAHVEKGANSKTLVCKVRFYGESLGDGVRYKLRSNIDEVLQTDEIAYIPDKSKEHVYYKDEVELSRNAVDGYVVSTYLQRFENGTMVDERLVTNDRYNPRPAQYWQGTSNR